MTVRSMAIAAMLACPAAASAAEDKPPQIVAGGSGRVTTAPDLATIDYRIVGGGPTSDAAVSAMVARRKAVDAGLASLTSVMPTASQVSVNEVRGATCQRSYGQPRLSTGDCAIIGYVASLSMTLRTPAVKEAGTIVGLLGRLEATEPRLGGFSLADPRAAQRRAIAAALVDARANADAIAASTGSRLGRLVTASTGQYYGGDIVVSASRVIPPPPPPPPAPPITVELAPRPIETQAQVTVAYEIAP